MQRKNTVDIKGLNKAELLAALYNNSKVLGMGFFGQMALGNKAGKAMTVEEAQDEIMQQGMNFDYLHGKVMKVNLSGDELYTALYNRDNGENAAEKLVEKLRQKVDLNNSAEQQARLSQVNLSLQQDPQQVIANNPIQIIALPNKDANDRNQQNNSTEEFTGLKKGFLRK